MRIRLTPPRNLEDWHSWFAWHPVVINNTLVWLERVERRLWVMNCGFAGTDSEWFYR